MKRAVTVVALLVLTSVSFLVAPEPASAGSSTDAALALGAFAVFNQIVRGETIFNGGYGAPHVARETVVVQQPAVIYAPPPPPPTVIYAPPPPVVYYAPPPPVVVYPNGYAYRAPYAYGAAGYYYKHHHRKRHHDDEDED